MKVGVDIVAIVHVCSYTFTIHCFSEITFIYSKLRLLLCLPRYGFSECEFFFRLQFYLSPYVSSMYWFCLKYFLGSCKNLSSSLSQFELLGRVNESSTVRMKFEWISVRKAYSSMVV